MSTRNEIIASILLTLDNMTLSLEDESSTEFETALEIIEDLRNEVEALHE